MQACFGRYWDGTANGSCKKECEQFHECLARFARYPLKSVQETLGPKATAGELAGATGVNVTSILLAINFQHNAGIKPLYKEVYDEPEPEPVEEPAEELLVKNELQVEETEEPGPLVKTRDPIHDKSRWTRERERYPLIAMLRPGMKLKRKYKGAMTETIVRKDHYLRDGVRYPTLYSAMISITGTKSYPKQRRADGTRPKGTREMTTMSAVRFYKLKKLFDDKGVKKRAKKKR